MTCSGTGVERKILIVEDKPPTVIDIVLGQWDVIWPALPPADLTHPGALTNALLALVKFWPCRISSAAVKKESL